MNVESSSSTLPTKLELWEDKSKQCKWDIALKVAAIAGAILLTVSFTAAMFAFPYIAPITVPLAFIIGSCVLAPIGLTGLIGSLALPFVFNFTNYNNPENAKKALQSVKEEGIPQPIDYFKRLHRYGIISDSELQERKDLKEDISRYRSLESEQRSIISKVAANNSVIDKINGLDSMKNQLNLEIKELNNKNIEITNEMEELMDKFNKFANNIESFDLVAER